MSEETPTPEKKKKKFRLSGWIIGPLLVLLLFSGVAGGLAWNFLNSPPEKEGQEVEIVIPKGTSFVRLSGILERLNIITDSKFFELYARYMGSTEKLKSGRYALNTGWTPAQVLDHLINGTPVLDRITLPEGLTWWETGRRLEEAGFVNFEDFKAVIHDTGFLRHYGISGKNAEGYLFPDTYFLMRPLVLNKESARQIAGRLVDTFWRRMSTVWYEAKDAENASMVQYYLTLASIIEKETAVASERTRVSGVYSNRLKKKMLLQADPTIIYGVGPSFSGSILRSQLNDSTNLYNTYKHPGLPPGPICSPGLESIKAARHPETHSYLFFVARGDGSHAFSKTLEEHNRHVRVFRENQKKGAARGLLPGGVR